MNKKKMITVLGATVIAASAFVSTSTAQAVSSTQVTKLVQKAVDAGTVLKWAISVGGKADGTTRPWNQYNAAKTARDNAVKAINTLPAAQRNVHLTKIQDGVDVHIDRSMRYIDAITAGEKIKVKQAVLAAKISKGVIDDETEKAYHELSFELKKQTALLDKVYGQTTRDLIRGKYKEAAQDVRDSVKYAVTVKMELDQANKALEANDLAAFQDHLAKANQYMDSVSNAKMKGALGVQLKAAEAKAGIEDGAPEVIDIY